MALILNIETATKNCSVSIAKDGICLGILENNDGNYSHAEKLHQLIEQLLINLQLQFSTIDAIAISQGPGSYTGLRIGVSAAKGLAYGLNLPLISVNTLENLALQVDINNGMIVPMLDARRLEVYTAIYNHQHQIVKNTHALILDENSFSEALNTGTVVFLGDGAAKFETLINHKNAHFIANTFPSAKEMSKLSFEKFIQNEFENVAYFEPFYLKDFLVNPEKKKV